MQSLLHQHKFFCIFVHSLIGSPPCLLRSVNPARSFGPAMVSRTFHQYWLFWVGPLVGAAIAVFLYEVVFRVRVSTTMHRICTGSCCICDIQKPEKHVSPASVCAFELRCFIHQCVGLLRLVPHQHETPEVEADLKHVSYMCAHISVLPPPVPLTVGLLSMTDVSTLA